MIKKRTTIYPTLWMLFLVFFDSRARNVTKKLGCTDSSAYQVKRALIEKGLITTEKKGRSKLMSLTEKGKVVQEACMQIVAQIDEMKPRNDIKYRGKNNDKI